MAKQTKQNGTVEVKVTAKELALLQGVVRSEFQDGRNPVGNAVWSWSATENAGEAITSARSAGGVAASLAKKGLVTISDASDTEACIAITQRGYDVLAERGLVNPPCPESAWEPEERCPARPGDTHSEEWWDGEACVACGAGPMSEEQKREQGMIEDEAAEVMAPLAAAVEEAIAPVPAAAPTTEHPFEWPAEALVKRLGAGCAVNKNGSLRVGDAALAKLAKALPGYADLDGVRVNSARSITIAPSALVAVLAAIL